MKKDFEKILAKLDELEVRIDELRKLNAEQSAQIEALRKQLRAVSIVGIEENGKQTEESYNNLILDELISLKKKLEGFSAESLRGVVNDVAALKNSLSEKSEETAEEFSLAELKSELLKLADMMTV